MTLVAMMALVVLVVMVPQMALTYIICDYITNYDGGHGSSCGPEYIICDYIKLQVMMMLKTIRTTYPSSMSTFTIFYQVRHASKAYVRLFAFLMYLYLTLLST